MALIEHGRIKTIMVHLYQTMLQSDCFGLYLPSFVVTSIAQVGKEGHICQPLATAVKRVSSDFPLRRQLDFCIGYHLLMSFNVGVGAA